MTYSRLLGVAALAASLLGGSISVAGCTGGISGTPYGENGATKPRKSTEATTAAEMDAGEEATPRPARRTTSASSVADASVAAIVDSGPPPTVASTCTGKGLTCENCCFDKTPGGTAIAQRMDATFADCIFFEQCDGNLDCEDFCNDQAINAGCSGKDAACDQIDSCIETSNCY